jgi:putative salt-induced outer membrane protein YdiY
MKLIQFFPLLLSLPVAAVVNIENMNAQPTRIGWSGLAEAALEARYGNSEREAIKLAGRADWFSGEDTAFLVSAYEYGQSTGVKDADSFFLHGRYIDAQTRIMSYEAFAQHEQNEFLRLKRRDLAGVGIRFVRDDNEVRMQNTYAVGVFHADERVEGLVQEPDQSETAIYGNLYWVFKWQINENTHLANTVYYQPAIKGDNDVHLMNLFALQVRIDGRLYLKMSIDINHDSEPPNGIKKTDTRLLSGISYEF